MIHAPLLIVLVATTVTLAGAAATRAIGIPTPVFLVVAGLALGFLPFVPDLTLNPDVVLIGLLPLLVFQAAFVSSPRALYQNAGHLGFLAIGLVGVTAVVTAVVSHRLAHLSWPMAFVLGAAVSATDPVAATSVAGRLGLSQRLRTILEGEGLLNDGTALVLFSTAVAAVTSGHFSAVHATLRLLIGSLAGVAFGLCIGVVGRLVRRWIDDPPIEIALSLVLAYSAYIPAQAAGASGVLATVAAGLYIGWHSPRVSSATTRLRSGAFWETLIFLLEAALFILVGMSFHSFAAAAHGLDSHLVVAGVVVVLAVVLTRLAWMFAIAPLAHVVGPGGVRGTWREHLVLGWSGMRGAITLAAVLAVPTTTAAGMPVSGRDDVIYLAFGVILATLLLQGLTLPVLVRHLRVVGAHVPSDAERQARLSLTRTALQWIDERGDRNADDGEALRLLRARYEDRLRLLDRRPNQPTRAERDHPDGGQVVGLEAIDAQRCALLALRDEGTIEHDVLRAIEHDLDLEEAPLR